MYGIPPLESILPTLAAASEVGSGLETLLLILGIIGLVLVVPYMLRRGRRGAAASAAPSISDAHGRFRATADKAMVDLLETSREISAQVDMKVRLLNKLVKDADRESRRLEKLLEAAGETRTLDRIRAEYDVAAEPTASPAPATPPAPAPSAPPVPETPLPPAEEAFNPRTKSGRWRSDVKSRVADLRAAGKEVAEIARITRLSTTEINLVLHLLESEER